MLSADKSLLALEQQLREKEALLQTKAGGTDLPGSVAAARPRSAVGAGSSSQGAGGGGCHYCGQPGHFRRECEIRRADEARGIFRSDIWTLPRGGGGGASGSGSGGGRSGSGRAGGAGASGSAGDRSLLHSFRPGGPISAVAWGNRHHSQVTGMGELQLRTSDGKPVIVQDVLHVPDATLTLLSVDRLMRRGSTITFGRGKVAVRRSRETLFAGHRRNGLFPLEVEPLRVPEAVPAPASKGGNRTGAGGNSCGKAGNAAPSSSTGAESSRSDTTPRSSNAAGTIGSVDGDASCNAKDLERAWEWHRRLGHLGFRSMRLLAKSGMVDGLDVSPAALAEAEESVCGTCVMAKGAAAPFPSRGNRPLGALELVHSDLCGPMPVTGRGKALYFVTLLDSAMGYSAVRVLTSKDRASDAVKDMVAQLEARHPQGAKLRALQSDRGGEYIATGLEDWLIQRSAAHYTSAPHTPQQNGAAERLNRTLMDRTRAMLQEAQLPDYLWPEAVVVACGMRNFAPSAGRNKTPWELFFGVKPNITTLHTFGCMAYVRVPEEQRQKLDPRALEGTFVGYERGSAAWRVLVDGRIVVSRDVEFVEEVRGPASRQPRTRFGSSQPGQQPEASGQGEQQPNPSRQGEPTPPQPQPQPQANRPATRSQRPTLHKPLGFVYPIYSGSGDGKSCVAEAVRDTKMMPPNETESAYG
ncbi:hypothetical protein GPECTOR_355g117 [Gonium pectorale]|uniref:Integrase catalytic domain-containing protein n=1 Tax=Gonium pectorale TaxID=33097 RepID=A0A150FVL8_GONPE|nr:hypothetical protein GPECTOR_355g117 [Gonium pectorale]|eukprot:KXZ41627.1 hypothetical protein GPECTOR_355g117 [Gonium pectorale]